MGQGSKKRFLQASFLVWLVVPTAFLIANVIRFGPQGWQTSDWLIDYSAGPIRRGFTGEILGRFSELLDADRLLITTLLQVTLYTIFVALVYRLTVSRPLSTQHIFALFSPLALGFYLSDPQAAMKKELIVLLLAAILFNWRPVTKSSSIVLGLLAFSLFLLGAFSHEIVILAGIPMLYISLRVAREFGHKDAFMTWVLPTSVLTMLVALTFSLAFQPSKAQVAQLCSNLIVSTGFEQVCDGAIDFLALDSNQTRALVLDIYQFGTGRTLTFLLALLIAATILVWSGGFGFGTRVFLISIASFAPAFFTSVDWGRWLMLAFLLGLLAQLRFDFSNTTENPVALKPQYKRTWFAAVLLGSIWSIGSIPSTLANGGTWALWIMMVIERITESGG